MVTVNRARAASPSDPLRGVGGTMLSWIQDGSRGYVPVHKTSSAGARLKLGILCEVEKDINYIHN